MGKTAGLSPRGRGKHMVGERPPGPSRVYPRVGGANFIVEPVLQSFLGLSPRGRGNPWRARTCATIRRSIPAWAGQPPVPPFVQGLIAVYPRVGGANQPLPTLTTKADGLSPRGRGKRLAKCPKPDLMGLSPRGRGNRDNRVLPGGQAGSIPAWAGQPLCG